MNIIFIYISFRQINAMAIIIKDWSHAGDTHSNVITVKRSTSRCHVNRMNASYYIIHNVSMYVYCL